MGGEEGRRHPTSGKLQRAKATPWFWGVGAGEGSSQADQRLPCHGGGKVARPQGPGLGAYLGRGWSLRAF